MGWNILHDNILFLQNIVYIYCKKLTHIVKNLIHAICLILKTLAAKKYLVTIFLITSFLVRYYHSFLRTLLFMLLLIWLLHTNYLRYKSLHYYIR